MASHSREAVHVRAGGLVVKTHITTEKDIEGNLHFHGTVTAEDLNRLRLDPFDKAVIFSPIEQAADILQSLEIVFRRMREQNIG